VTAREPNISRHGLTKRKTTWPNHVWSDVA